MEGDEIFVLVFTVIVGLIGWVAFTPSSSNRLVARNAACIGMLRLPVLLSVGWIIYVLWNHSDPSVTFIYRIFYLLIGLCVVLALGRGGATAFGARVRADIIERENWAAAIFHAAFVLATGLIYGGSLWGDADATGDDEGGWWIPIGFFVAGWSVLILGLVVYRRQERGFVMAIRQNRDWRAGMAAAFYTLSAASVLTQAVAGDFYGWWHGLVPIGAMAGMVLVHYGFATFLRGRAFSAEGVPVGRLLESAAYVAFALASWWVNAQIGHWMKSLETSA